MKESLLRRFIGNIHSRFLDKGGDVLKVSWDSHRNNFGDILNPIIVKGFSSKRVERISSAFLETDEHFFVIGSILQRCTNKTIVWGSGLISEDAWCKQHPMRICAVRGPLTRKSLLSQGIDCPEIYGDPALLLPGIYNPVNRAKKFNLGIIPHYLDKSNGWLKKLMNKNHDVKIIDIQNKKPLQMVDEICQCEKIASSSLHGLIIADAYDIPSKWIEFSDKIKGNGFKFRDYFASVHRKDTIPFIVNHNTTIGALIDSITHYEIKIDLTGLRKSCPF